VQKLLAGPLGPLLVRFMGRRSFDRSFSTIFGKATQPTAEQLETLWVLITRENGLAAAPAMLGYMRERRAQRERWVGALRDTKIPLALVNGSDDFVSGAHMIARFRELFGASHAKIVELPEIGHYPQLEAPERVASEALSFFAASPPVPPPIGRG
jgi:pimeloyl-ACP methyl ester carboxylesterase